MPQFLAETYTPRMPPAPLRRAPVTSPGPPHKPEPPAPRSGSRACDAGSVAWPERAWAVEGAGGLGRMLARQLVAAGERVLDVQPKLAARGAAAGAVTNNDPDDARSAAVTALRSWIQREVVSDDHSIVLKVWSRRHRDLAGPAPRSPAGCMRRCAGSSPAGSARRSPRPTPPGCWSRSPRPARCSG